MANSKPRAALDSNVIIAGLLWPRWPYEVLQAARSDSYQLVLLVDVMEEVRRNAMLKQRELQALDVLLATTGYELLPTAAVDRGQHAGLIRSRKDVPIAVALMVGRRKDL